MSNLEKDFRKTVVDSAAEQGLFVLDIPDELKSIMNMLPSDLQKILANRIKKKPFDLGMLYQGIFCALELKLFKREWAFVPRNVLEMPHQYDGLKGVYDNGGISGMLVCFNRGLTAKDKKRLNWDSWLLCLTFFLPFDIIDIDKSYSVEELISMKLEVPLNGKFLDIKSIYERRQY